jgi:hypothetical protein
LNEYVVRTDHHENINRNESGPTIDSVGYEYSEVPVIISKGTNFRGLLHLSMKNESVLNYAFKDDSINNYLIIIVKCLSCPLLQFVGTAIPELKQVQVRYYF